MKKLIAALLIFCFVSVFSAGVTATASEDYDIDEVADLIARWEMLYLKYVDTEDFYEVLSDEGELNIIAKDYICRIIGTPWQEKTGNDYMEYDDRLIVINSDGYDKTLLLFETVFDKDTAKKALNNSNLIFDDTNTYLSSVVCSGAAKPVINYKIDERVRSREVKELKDRLTLTQIEDGKIRVDFVYYLRGEEENSSLIIKKTDGGYRVCELDGLLFKEDTLANEGYRKYRLVENDFNPNPQTSDAPVIAVCALAISSAAAIVLLKKKKN